MFFSYNLGEGLKYMLYFSMCSRGAPRCIYISSTLVTPGLLQKMSKKCNSPGEFPGLVVFLAVFVRKFYKKITQCNSPGVTTVPKSILSTNNYNSLRNGI